MNRVHLKAFVSLLCIAGLFAGCGGTGTGSDSNATVPANRAGPGMAGTSPSPSASPGVQVSFRTLQTQIFQPRCISCHQSPNGAAGVNLDSYAALIGSSVTHGHPVVMPGNAQDSHLFESVNDHSMPPSGGPLSQTEINEIRDWINQGAQNN